MCGLELLAIIIAVKVWVQKLKNRRFVVSCDNEAAVFAITTGRIRDPNILACLRELWYYAAVYQYDVRVIHVPGVNNTIPDYLSRCHINDQCQKRFRESNIILKLRQVAVKEDVFIFKQS